MDLKELQEWFGKAIGTPLYKELPPATYVIPGKRLEVYHQQYWWRLLKCLQENFPLLVRLYGYESFNREIGVPYLTDHPPDHWALCRLGQSLPAWLKKDLDRDSARIDAAAQRAFWTQAYEPIDSGSLTKRIMLQPHVHLFELGGDLFTFRDTLLEQEVSYWREHPLPPIRQGRAYFTLYRNPRNDVKWKELTKEEYLMLTLFQKGTTIHEACDHIATLDSGEWELIPLWFREWTFLKFFCEVI